jgi:hypothetical protein
MAEDQPEGIAKGEPHPDAEGPQDFVVVLAYTAAKGELEDEFVKFVNDFKAMYTFKENMRIYALVEGAAKNVLSKVEKSSAEPSGRAVMVISFDQPGDTDEAIEKMSQAANKIRSLFEGQPDVKVNAAIRETADEVLSAFPEEAR